MDTGETGQLAVVSISDGQYFRSTLRAVVLCCPRVCSKVRGFGRAQFDRGTESGMSSFVSLDASVADTGKLLDMDEPSSG